MGKLNKTWETIKWAWGILKQAWLYTVLLSASLAIIYGGITLIFPSIIIEPITMPLAILQMSAIAFVIIFIFAMVGLIIVRLIEERFPNTKSMIVKQDANMGKLPPAIKVQINSKDFTKNNSAQTKQFFDGITQSFTDYIRAFKEWEKLTKVEEINATKESKAYKGKNNKNKGESKKGGETQDN